MENKKLTKDLVIQKVTKIMKFIGNWILIGSVSISTFFIGYYYPKIKETITGEKKEVVLPKTRSEITISVTDRGELMMMNRKTGTFEIFTEEVGRNIFKSYGRYETQGKGK
jgi:hypothetical protein